MPSINRLINTGQVVRYHLAVILMLESYPFKKLRKRESLNSLIINDINIKNLSFRYEGNLKYTIKNLNLKIKRENLLVLLVKVVLERVHF